MQAQLSKDEIRRTGELLATENGKIIVVRVLGDGKLEYSYQGMGKLLGIHSTSMYTAVATMHPGALVFEANGVVTTMEGDAVTVKIWGINRSTGPGLRASGRGGAITKTRSSRLAARLNNIPNVWEVEVDEAGTYQLKVWEWK
jgi:hypothetical protein